MAPRLLKAVGFVVALLEAEGLVPPAVEKCHYGANINLYTGSQRCGWHSDNEAIFEEPDGSSVVASLSVGASAIFRWRPTANAAAEGSVLLKEADLLIMAGPCQTFFQHCADSPQSGHQRLNVTVRKIARHQRGCPLALHHGSR